MAFDTNNLNAYDFIKSFKESMGEKLQERLESGEFFPVLEESESVRKREYFDSEEKAQAFIKKHPEKKAKMFVGQKSGRITVVWSEEKKTYGIKPGAQSRRVPDTFSSENLKEEFEALEEHVRKDAMDVDWTLVGETEKNAVVALRALGKQLGSDEGAYASGVLCLSFKNKQAVEDFATALENDENVDTYEIEAVREDLVHGFVEDQEYDFGDVMFDKDFEFNVYIYLVPEIVSYPAEELEVGDEFEWDDDEDNGFITEVKRKIKVNFRGKKRIKMQCSPGFKWDPAAKTCKKISGAQIAVMRKAMRRAVLTKRSMGQSFKARVLRKSRKAKRFRKSFGLQ